MRTAALRPHHHQKLLRPCQRRRYQTDKDVGMEGKLHLNVHVCGRTCLSEHPRHPALIMAERICGRNGGLV